MGNTGGIPTTEGGKKPKKKHMGLIAGIVVLVIIIIVVAVAVNSMNSSNSPGNGTTSVKVTAVDLSIVYLQANSGLSGYLGSPNQTLKGFTTATGNVVTYNISFTVTGNGFYGGDIQAIYLNTSGFSITSSTSNLLGQTSLPFAWNSETISTDNPFTVTINIQVPTTSYNGVINLTVTTNG